MFAKIIQIQRIDLVRERNFTLDFDDIVVDIDFYQIKFRAQIILKKILCFDDFATHNGFQIMQCAFINQGIKRGIFKKRDPDYAANILLSLITGIAFAYATINEQGFDSKRMEKELSNLIFGYL